MVEQDVVEDEARKRMKEEVEWNVEEVGRRGDRTSNRWNNKSGGGGTTK